MTTQTTTTHQGVSHIGTIQVDPGDVDRFLVAFRKCWLEVCKEPECVYFEVFQSQAEAGLFHFVEVWARDNEWFMEVQIKKEYYKPYWEITKPLWIHRDLHTYNRLSGWNFVDQRYLKGSIGLKGELK